MASVASDDYIDGGQAAANHMGSAADTALIQNSFSSSQVPQKVNANNDVVYLGGHGDYNWMTTGSGQGFMADHTTTQGDTEELNSMPDAVIVASGCHNGVSFGNKLYHDYDTSTTYGDFPERFANKGVGIYMGSIGYTWISISGSSTNVAYNGWSELLATDFVKHLLHDGGITAGKAYKAAVTDYVSVYGGNYSSSLAHRRVLAIATLYGIPNYRWSSVHIIPWRPIDYWLERYWIMPPFPEEVLREEFVLQIRDWRVHPSGLIDIDGAGYSANDGEPILPIVVATRASPGDSNVVGVAWNQAESVSTTISNDVPLASMGLGTGSIPEIGSRPFSSPDFYPPTPYFGTTVSTLGGDAVEVATTIVPVQYDQSTHRTRIWTRMVFDIEYEVNQTALQTDSDGDGVPDYWESAYGLDPNEGSGDQGASGDPDVDGLTNAQEHNRALGTNPVDPDTDHDGSSDGREVQDGTDPLNPGSPLRHLFCRSSHGPEPASLWSLGY